MSTSIPCIIPAISYPLVKAPHDADFGGGLPTEQQVTCPTGTAVSGTSVVTSDADLVHAFNFACRNLSDPTSTRKGWRGPKRTTATANQEIGCGTAAVATGISGLASAAINALGLPYEDVPAS
ncbi:MAG: hypothetical protein ABI216_08115 [Devosia sp.]